MPLAEAETVASGLRQIDFLQAEIKAIDVEIARTATGAADFKRLTTIPGVDVGTAAAVMAAIGDIRRFESARELAAYLVLDPTSRQSGKRPARGGLISKRGNPGPLDAGRGLLGGDMLAGLATRGGDQGRYSPQANPGLSLGVDR